MTLEYHSKSVLYDGGGDDGAAANGKALQEGVVTSAVPLTADVIAVGDNNILELFVANLTAAETVTLNVNEYSAATPSPQTLIRPIPVATGADSACTVEALAFERSTAEYYAKTPIRIAVTPGTYIMISVQDAGITGPVFCRYQLKGAM